MEGGTKLDAPRDNATQQPVQALADPYRNLWPLGPAWEFVRRIPGLPGEAKLAWFVLWQLSGGRPDKINVNLKCLAGDQSTSVDSGRRYLERLAIFGLVRVISQGASWVVIVCEPREACRDCDWAAAIETQLELDFSARRGGEETADARRGARDIVAGQTGYAGAADGDRAGSAGSASERAGARDCSGAEGLAEKSERGSASCVANADPRSALRLPSETFGNKRKLETLDLRPSVLSEESNLARSSGGTAQRGSASGSDSGPQRLGAKLGSHLAELLGRAFDGERQCGDLERLITYIERRVDDGRLRVAPIKRVAEAVLDGRLPEGKLWSILINLDRHRRAGTLETIPSAYFVRSAQRAFRESGLAWPTQQQSHF